MNQRQTLHACAHRSCALQRENYVAKLVRVRIVAIRLDCRALASSVEKSRKRGATDRRDIAVAVLTINHRNGSPEIYAKYGLLSA